LLEPETVALNVAEPPFCTEAVVGEIETETTGAGGAEVTCTAALALFVESAMLVALTVAVPVPLAGGV